MKIQHWAIIFIIVILPFSIVTRYNINKKASLLKEETRYNNVIDNASYDAAAQLNELAGYDVGEDGVPKRDDISPKNINVNYNVANEAIERFFNTLAVNFNFPMVKQLNDYSRSNAKEYFSQYVPAIVIVGYDGIYVCSYDEVEINGGAKEYRYVLKPKIPYAYSISSGSNKIVINFTLDNYVRIYFENSDFQFGDEGEKVPYIEGYIGGILDTNLNGEDDFAERKQQDIDGIDEYYKIDTDPFRIETDYAGNSTGNAAFAIAMEQATQNRKNADLGYFLFMMRKHCDLIYNTQIAGDIEALFNAFKEPSDNINYNETYGDNTDVFTKITQDYEYLDDGQVKTEASPFNKLRRSVIIDLIQSVLREEFNEHNAIAKNMGITYDFSIPDIGRDQWNNTIDDVSILSFIQGMPMGYETYYNNYSLGGARIIEAPMYYGEVVKEADDDTEHFVYHKNWCPLIPKHENGEVWYDTEHGYENDVENNPSKFFDVRYPNATFGTTGDRPVEIITDNYIKGPHSDRKSSGIRRRFLSEDHAIEGGYYPCSYCM